MLTTFWWEGVAYYLRVHRATTNLSVHPLFCLMAPIIFPAVCGRKKGTAASCCYHPIPSILPISLHSLDKKVDPMIDDGPLRQNRCNMLGSHINMIEKIGAPVMRRPPHRT